MRWLAPPTTFRAPAKTIRGDNVSRRRQHLPLRLSPLSRAAATPPARQRRLPRALRGRWLRPGASHGRSDMPGARLACAYQSVVADVAGLCSRIANVTPLDLAKELKPVELSAQGVDQTSTGPLGEPQSVVSVSMVSAEDRRPVPSTRPPPVEHQATSKERKNLDDSWRGQPRNS